MLFKVSGRRRRPDVQHVAAIENKWFDIMKNTTLFLYEFDPRDFILQDEIAGYYVSDKEQRILIGLLSMISFKRFLIEMLNRG